MPVLAPQLRSCLLAALLALPPLLSPGLAWPAAPQPGPPLTIQRAAGPIAIDGDLSDAGWQGIDAVTTWFETHVGDNVEPQVKNVALARLRRPLLLRRRSGSRTRTPS